MKRALLIAGLLGAVLLGLWLGGRAPTRYVLEEEGRAFYKDRLRKEQVYSLRIGKLEPGPERSRLEQERETNRRATRKLAIRGWEVLLIPYQAARPDPAGFLVLEPVNASGPMDHPGLIGPIQVWVRPVGALAKLMRTLRISP